MNKIINLKSIKNLTIENLAGLGILSLILLMVSVSMLGCSSSKGPAAITDPGIDEPIPVLPPAVVLLEDAEKYFNSGDYPSALSRYQRVLLEKPTSEQAAEAYIGLGWARIKTQAELTEIISTFEKVPVSYLDDDGLVGIAMSYLARNGSGDIANTIAFLERLNSGSSGSSSYFVYNPRLNTGISSAVLHAMLSYAYFIDAQLTRARQHMNYARHLDPGSLKVQEIDKVLELLGLWE